MKINNIILKERTIKVFDFPPDSKMNIETTRNNEMQTEVTDDYFPCTISFEIKLTDSDKKELVYIKISNIIIVEKGNEEYKKDIAESIFNSLKSMYLKTANDLLKEADYPPLPFNVDI